MNRNKLIIALLITGFFAACHDNNASKPTVLPADSSTVDKKAVAMPSLDRAITPYVELKDALSNENEQLAKSKADQLLRAIKSFDKDLLTAGQQKAFSADEADLEENAEHIAKSEISHQREHFEALSEVMYNMVQAIGTSQSLYLVECKVGKDSRIWLSNAIDHKNPYLGNAGAGCFQVKEQIPAINAKQ